MQVLMEQTTNSQNGKMMTMQAHKKVMAGGQSDPIGSQFCNIC